MNCEKSSMRATSMRVESLICLQNHPEIRVVLWLLDNCAHKGKAPAEWRERCPFWLAVNQLFVPDRRRLSLDVVAHGVDHVECHDGFVGAVDAVLGEAGRGRPAELRLVQRTVPQDLADVSVGEVVDHPVDAAHDVVGCGRLHDVQRVSGDVATRDVVTENGGELCSRHTSSFLSSNRQIGHA